MPCENCGAALATGTEQKLRVCVDCAHKMIDEVRTLRNKNQELGDGNLILEGKIEKYLEAVALQEKLHVAQKLGDTARERDASLNDNPYDPDSDEAAAWSYGWLTKEVMMKSGHAQTVITWSFGMLAVVRDLALGGASGDEVAAKIESILISMEPYVPEQEESKQAETA